VAAREPAPAPAPAPTPARDPAPAPGPARDPAAAAAAARAAATAAAAAKPSAQPSEDRIRQLYADLVETKRKQNESTAAITYQSVAKSILESSDRLQKKHGRSVDFEVMVKDGKAVLRPVIK
jgi:hypothetical protein